MIYDMGLSMPIHGFFSMTAFARGREDILGGVVARG